MANEQAETKPNPDYAVDRETLTKFFHPPIGRSTFHDLVNRGKIIPVKGIRGYYLLNESLRRMGLREVAALPSNPHCSPEDYVRIAFNLIDENLFPLPPVMMTWEPQQQDWSYAWMLAEKHRAAIEQCEEPEMKIAYASGVMDAEYMLRRLEEEG